MTPILLPPDGGRRCPSGPLPTALFEAEEAETAERYSVAEWRMEPGFSGVAAHWQEAIDEIVWAVEDRPEVLVGEAWQTVAPGAFARIPAGVLHDFRNRSDAPSRFGGIERQMPAIAEWFERNG